MRRSRILGAALLAAITAAAAAARAVSVEADANAPAEVGRAVTFSARATGSGAITYSWNFGDGTITEPSAGPERVTRLRRARSLRGDRDRPGPDRPAQRQLPADDPPAAHRRSRDGFEHDRARCGATPRLQRQRRQRQRELHRHRDAWSARSKRRSARTRARWRSAPTVDLGREPGRWDAQRARRGRERQTGRSSSVRGAAPFGVVTNPAGDTVFVTLQGTGEVVAFDAASGSELARGRPGISPAGIAVSADGSARARHELHLAAGSRRGPRARRRDARDRRASTGSRSTPARTAKRAAAACRTTCARW